MHMPFSCFYNTVLLSIYKFLDSKLIGLPSRKSFSTCLHGAISAYGQNNVDICM